MAVKLGAILGGQARAKFEAAIKAQEKAKRDEAARQKRQKELESMGFKTIGRKQ